MSRLNSTQVLAMSVTLLAGCAGNSPSSGNSPSVVTDTLGNVFDVSCTGGLCKLAPRDQYLVPRSCGNGSGTDAFVLAMDTVLSIYAVRVSPTGDVRLEAANPSRPVACTSNTNCLDTVITAAGGAPGYACTNGLCQCASAACASQDGLPWTYDVLTLCQADILWPTRCPYITSQPFADRNAEVASLCGAKDTCAFVPADCRQLTAAAPVDAGGEEFMPAESVDAGL